MGVCTRTWAPGPPVTLSFHGLHRKVKTTFGRGFGHLSWINEKSYMHLRKKEMILHCSGQPFMAGQHVRVPNRGSLPSSNTMGTRAQVEGNPCLAYISMVIFPWFGKLTVNRKDGEQ